MMRPGTMLAAMLVMLTAGATAHAKMELRTFPVLAGAGAHDVYPAPDGAVWFTAQSAGKLGHLDPRTGKSDFIATVTEEVQQEPRTHHRSLDQVFRAFFPVY
jgi:streptogramin lyase